MQDYKHKIPVAGHSVGWLPEKELPVQATRSYPPRATLASLIRGVAPRTLVHARPEVGTYYTLRNG